MLRTPTSDLKTDDLAPVRPVETFVTEDIETPKVPEMGTGELLNTARKASWIISGVDDLVDLGKTYDDSEAKINTTMFDDVSDEFTEDQLTYIHELAEKKVTASELEDTLADFRKRNDLDKRLAEQGGAGLAANVTMSLADPTMLGITAGSIALGDKVSGLIVAGNRGARIGSLISRAAKAGFTANAKRTRIAKGLGEAIVAETGIAALRSEIEKDYTTADAAIDMALSMSIVGGFEAGMAHRLHKQAVLAENGLQEQKLRDLGMTEEQIVSTRSASAMEADRTAGSFRVDDFGRMMNSKNPELQTFAENVLQDGVKGGTHSAAIKAYAERTKYESQRATAMLELQREVGDAYRLSPMERVAELQTLSNKVWEAIVLDADHGEAVTKAAAKFRKINASLQDDAIRSELNGFVTDMAKNPNYMRQEMDEFAWREIQREASEEDLVELMYRGLSVEDQPLDETISALARELEEATAPHSVSKTSKPREGLLEDLEYYENLRTLRRKVAAGFVHRYTNRINGSDMSLDAALESDEGLVAWLKGQDSRYATMSDEELREEVRKALYPAKRNTKNTVDRGKRRMQLNPKASIELNGKTVRLADLMNRDAFGLQQSYNHEMTGHIAMANRAGIKGPSDWNELLKRASEAEIALQFKSNKTAKTPSTDSASKTSQRIEKQLNEMKREVYGYNRYESLGSDLNRAVGVGLQYNFTRLMGKVAWSMFAEMGNVLAENGMRNTLKMIPALPRVLGDAFRNINKNDHVIREINEYSAAFGDEYLIRYFGNFDETGVRDGTLTSGILNKAEVIAHSGSQAMAKMSFIAQFDKALRLTSNISALNSLHGHLMKGQTTRLGLKRMGLTAEKLANIKRNMTTHGVTTGKLGNVEKLNLDKWDAQTRDDLVLALTEMSNRQVQKAIAGEKVALTSHPVGRVFLQFRTFAIEAYTKHLRADMHDAASGERYRLFLKTIYGSIFAALGYSSRSYVSTLGMTDSEREEYLKERMAPERLAANAMAYQPTLGVAVTAWNATGGTVSSTLNIPVSRASGLHNDAFGNPLFDAVNKAQSLGSNVEDTNAETAYQTARYLIPFQNTIWVEGLSNKIASELKE